ncbi:MAG TPA: hypothetical protein VD791_11140 [Burkholderiales bacterium]|nr:hypothetical protein [Burkholderiales bacterium]
MKALRALVPAALALAAAALGAAAQDAWETLGPGAIGAGRAELETRLALHCQADTCRPAAGTADRFAGVPVERIDLAFDADRLARVTVRFDTQHYERVREAVRDRFGEGADHSYLARAGMAGEFAAGVFVWSGPGLALVLEQYAGKITRSQLVYGTPRALAALVRDKSATPRGARRDL